MTSSDNIQRPSLFWRWSLITTEALGVIFLVFVETIGGRENAFTHSTLVSIFGLLSGISVFFLLFVSPFLIRSQKLLAVVGWLIGAAGLLIPMVFY